MVKRRSVRTMCPMPHRTIHTNAVHARMAIGMSRRRAHLDETASVRDTASGRVVEDIKGNPCFSFRYRVETETDLATSELTRILQRKSFIYTTFFLLFYYILQLFIK